MWCRAQANCLRPKGDGAIILVKRAVRALHQQVIIHFAQYGAEGVGISKLPSGGSIARLQPVGVRRGAGNQSFKETRIVTPDQIHQRSAIPVNDADEFGMRHEGPDH